MKYKQKPVVVEAIQWDGKNGEAVEMWAKDRATSPTTKLQRTMVRDTYELVFIGTCHGIIQPDPNDYIICNAAGELSRMKPHEFVERFEAAK